MHSLICAFVMGVILIGNQPVANNFSVNINVSDEAQDLLDDYQEPIIVTVSILVPVDNKLRNKINQNNINDDGEIEIAHREAELTNSGNLNFDALPLDQNIIGSLDYANPRLRITVSSARRAVVNNLLKCDNYDGTLEKMGKAPLRIDCTSYD